MVPHYGRMITSGGHRAAIRATPMPCPPSVVGEPRSILMVLARGRSREKDLKASQGFTSVVPRQHVEVVCATFEY